MCQVEVKFNIAAEPGSLYQCGKGLFLFPRLQPELEQLAVIESIFRNSLLSKRALQNNSGPVRVAIDCLQISQQHYVLLTKRHRFFPGKSELIQCLLLLALLQKNRRQMMPVIGIIRLVIQQLTQQPLALGIGAGLVVQRQRLALLRQRQLQPFFIDRIQRGNHLHKLPLAVIGLRQQEIIRRLGDQIDSQCPFKRAGGRSIVFLEQIDLCQFTQHLPVGDI